MSITRILSDNTLLSSGIFNPGCVLDKLESHLNTTNQNITSLSQGGDGPNYLQVTKLAEAKLLEKKQSLEAHLKLLTHLRLLNSKYYRNLGSPVYQACCLFIYQICFLIYQPDCRGRLDEIEVLEKHLEKINEELKKNKSIQSFLKVIKIDVELVSLCGECCGDEKGRLDQAWKAFQQGTGTQEQYRKLEERRNYLTNKKITLQPLCTDASIAKINEMRPHFIQLCISERKEALEAIAFVKGLEAWCNEPCQEGKAARCFAAMKIFVCHVYQKTDLDLGNTELTSVPL